MEPITWSWLAGTVLSGVVGNRADAEVVRACVAGWQKAITRLDAPDLRTTKDELAIAMNRTLLWAQQSLVKECLDDFTAGTYCGVGGYTVLDGHETEVRWLIENAKRLNATLKTLEHEKSELLVEANISELEDLLQSQNPSNKLNNQLMMTIVQKDAPRIYRARASVLGTGLLARWAAFFQFELRTNQVVQNWFQTELLLKINAQLLTAKPLVFKDLDQELQEWAKQLPEVLRGLNNLVFMFRNQRQTLLEVRALVFQVLEEIQRKSLPKVSDNIVVTKKREGLNPFIYGPIVPPERFFGRRRIKGHIKTRIGGACPQSVNIVGFRLSGKSSLLHYVEERISEFCISDQKPLVVSLNLQESRFHTPTGILEELQQSVEKQLGSNKLCSEKIISDPRELRESLKAIRSKGYRLIVILDKFEAIGKRLSAFQDWGDDWRAKASERLLTLVVASRRPLTDIYRKLGVTSPFGNIFSVQFLGALEPETWQQLLVQGRLSDTEMSWIDDIAGKLPYYTQLAAAMIWQYETLEVAQQEFRKEARRRFRELWEELTTTERRAVQQIARGDASLVSTPVIENLMLYGLLRDRKQLYSSEFCAFVGEQK